MSQESDKVRVVIMDLAPEQRERIDYEVGHMMYVHEPSLKKFKATSRVSFGHHIEFSSDM